MSPVRTGVATNSAELVAALRDGWQIDVFVDEPLVTAAQHSAHDFVWRHRQHPYDVTVYQLGNSSHHNYLWPYLFRYPGLAVLHDAHLHHARAAALLTEKRTREYLDEFSAAHPDVSPDVAQLAVAGFDSYLYYMWPMTRLVVEASRLTAVHAPGSAEQLRAQFGPSDTAHPSCPPIETIALTQGVLVDRDREAHARREVRARHAIAADAVVFGVFGGLTPEKRIPQILDALAVTRAAGPSVHLLLAGAPAAQYDVDADVRARGLDAIVTSTGYVETDEALTDCIAACDVSLNLRWPTAREMSGPWLRALAAGKATVTIDLAHLWDVPSLDPRTWQPRTTGMRDPGTGVRSESDSRIPDPGSRTPDPGPRTPDPAPRTPDPGPRTPVTVAIDIVDEDHSLRLAMRRLAQDASLRASLGAAARDYWQREHSLERSVADYRRVAERARRTPDPKPALPPHLVNDGTRQLRELLEPFGLSSPLE